MNQRIGIIGGSGLYDIEGMHILDELKLETPWGKPSDALILARIGNHEVVFLPRHGRGHGIPPHQINYRANIYAMKLAGVNQIISISAVGSLREAIAPGHFVVVDQFVDRTHGRHSTFFEGPLVAHVSMADPVCATLRERLLAACRTADITTHDGGSYLCMQGPQFSTRAESNLYRSWGMDVIGMTNFPEGKLAREAEICYATVAMSTDYDCWHEEEADVSVEGLLEIMHGNGLKAKAMLKALFAVSDTQLHACHAGCRHALDTAVVGDLSIYDDAEIRPVQAVVERLLSCSRA
ncbi:MAG: S-methyl-5'-thioadenosine phosphorylase [Zetaproteobacteria bacterium CG12_big_fil_rev_8_21_14_0_65_55_1124]|nr:MAG: methylthioadenosine phosphorylase [Zetaproteobacteria bacterium CG1_02_55_237]PIS18743.1 MAG: S-methyl-5'-thioadenosine phosphorylase [Zetaproteobacteria bacterium CG08_land_8_20_14_0_20_55_17]PIW43975.1 MAG: S-methyl-5'-thioadenosine phosphorylase [Zetaproteobacteria bacterium CG12_big_fil_rev_8_21_14_0_65_55_1124]PIY52470.1 MAG: S-methyl-5'-thioadenosine phosphorylase [Zetaproteobacteria bacterium CG_4_10_14_0_8_um_filter_55_43]PIZ36749.1 MAG: S-methyl-5'-thioadenosine phosphorylase [